MLSLQLQAPLQVFTACDQLPLCTGATRCRGRMDVHLAGQEIHDMADSPGTSPAGTSSFHQ
jgi:hypothetical protein